LTFGCGIVVVVIVVVVACRRKRQRQRFSSTNRYISLQEVGNASRSTGNDSVFAVTPCVSRPPIVEEAPPSYREFMSRV